MDHVKGIGSVGHAPKVKSVQAVAVYDPKSGRIRHMHQVFVFEGGRVPDRQSVEHEALTNAKRFGHKTDELRLLYVPELPSHNAMYRVDIKTQSLIELPVPRVPAEATMLKKRTRVRRRR